MIMVKRAAAATIPAGLRALRRLITPQSPRSAVSDVAGCSAACQGAVLLQSVILGRRSSVLRVELTRRHGRRVDHDPVA
jgi:hypothetical protein